jgi:allantoinase
MRKRLTNLKIPTGGDATEPKDILVVDGRIAEIAPPLERGWKEEFEVVDLGGCLVLPGVIDGHVHFDDPGYTHRENFETGSRAAAAGGVTSVADMPCTSVPPVTSAANLRAKLEVIAPKAHIDFLLWGGLSANVMSEPGWRDTLGALIAEGVAAIKVYMLSGMDTFRDLTRPQLADLFREARRLGIPVGVHAEDRQMVLEIETRLRAEGRNLPLDYAASRPDAVEVSAAETIRELCRETGARVHIVHLASGRALDVVAAAREEGLALSAETCPHYLEFTEEDLERQGALLKTAPVVKSASDRDRLWRGLASGELEYVATDHAAGQWPEEKQTGSIWTDYGGVPGVELSLPCLYSEGVRKGRLTLERLTEITSSAPARFFGIEDRKGRIAPGFDADFAVLDENETWTVRSADLHNLNRYTPLEGRTLTGRVRATILRGETVYARGRAGTEFFGKAGYGRWCRRRNRIAS